MPANVYKLPLEAPTTVVSGDVIQTGSSFGLDMTTLGPEMDAHELYHSERAQELRFRNSFYRATNHDHKLFDMNGRMLRPGKLSNQPLLSGAVPTTYVPIDQRRPSTPYRLPRKIVNAFTGMVFGYGKFPQYRSDDPNTQDWSQAVSDKLALEINMIRARNLGGSCGTVGLSWALRDGELSMEVHKGYNIHVLEWENEAQRIPAHVVELYQIKERTKDPKQRYQWMWRRRDWTMTADIVFKPMPVTKKTPDLWEIDEGQSFEHQHGECHFHWIENLPDDDDDATGGGGGYDGAPDYAVAYDQLTSLDMLNSVNVQGGIRNLDPTVVLRMDEEDVGKGLVKKGSDNAVVTGKDGDAKYMELSGTSITAGTALVTSNRDQILEVTECVVPDPNSIAAAGTSSVALKMVYAPMLVKCSIMRYQYGRAITRLLDQITRCARELMPDMTAEDDAQRYAHVPVVDDAGQPVVDEETGEAKLEPVEFVINLPQAIKHNPKLDATGNPTGEMTTQYVDRHPGQGRIWLEWGPYFTPTAQDDQQESQALSTAAGGKPVMSQQTAVELHANAHDRDGQDEWLRVQREAKLEAQNQAVANGGMFPPIGGPTQDQPAGSDHG